MTFHFSFFSSNPKPQITKEAIVQALQSAIEKESYIHTQVSPELKQTVVDYIAKTEDGSQFYVFDIQNPKDVYLTYDVIAHAKTSSITYQAAVEGKVTPYVVGHFVESEDVKSFATDNGVGIINIPETISTDQMPDFISNSITEFTSGE